MPMSDHDIQRTAHFWIQRHADQAIAMARQMVEEMRQKGDQQGADMWLRIIVAIETLGAPPTDAQH
jgi:hypothetical protein